MDMNFEQKVRQKAYEIWVEAGMEDGMAHEHWVTAEQVVMNEVEAPVVKKAAGQKPAKPVAAKPVAAKKPAAKTAKAKTVKH